MPYHVPVCWVRSFGKGRVFFTSLGHNGSTWENETFHKHLIEGFKWSLKLTDDPSEPNPICRHRKASRPLPSSPPKNYNSASLSW